MSEVEIITDGGRRHRWSSAEKLRIVEETLDGSVIADGAYDTCNCHDVFADRGAATIVPPRKNAKPWKPTTAGAIARNEALRASK